MPPPPPVAKWAVPAGGPVSQRTLSDAEKECIKDEVAEEQRLVVLRVEVATKTMARLLTWSSILLSTISIALAIALIASQGAFKTLGELRDLYKSSLVVGSVCLGAVSVTLLWLGTSVRASLRERREWSKRQRYFVTTAAVFLACVLAYTACYVVGLATTLAQDDCSYDWPALAATEFVRRMAFSFVILFLFVRLSNMRLWRGDRALDLDPDYRLVVDRPLGDKLRSHLLVLILWLVLVAMISMNLAGRITQYNNGRRAGVRGCDTVISEATCKVTALQASSAVLSFAVNLLFVVLYALVIRAALRDHRTLPYCRYKGTHIFVRVQARVVAPVQVAVLLSNLLMEMVPSLRGSCMSVVAAQVGNLPMTLSLAVASVVFGVLYMPKSSEMDSPLVYELLQDFSWTQEAVPQDMERRNQRLLASMAAPAQAAQATLGEQVEGAIEDAIDYLPGMVRLAVGKLAGVQDAGGAVAQLASEPMFCVETAVRLYYWSRLAYRNEPELDNKHVNATTALALFDLKHWEKIEEFGTDTHCVLAWSDTRAVLAFRGTSSKENTLTDLKSWRVRYAPEPTWGGRRVGTHAGFLAAWTGAGFNQRVLDRLAAVDQERPAGSPPLRIWVTGHSLGGALAVLASQQISRTHPDSRLTLYTFGCPRVGNSAFAHMFNAAIPDAWAIVNRGDPVTMIPKVGFKRIGQRVNVDVDGNLIVRGGYFELSVVHRGTVVKNHTMGQYALALATILKSQFSPSKSLPGGAAGVEALLGAVDVGRALLVTHADLKALHDPQLAVVLTEKLEAQLAAEASKAGESVSKGRLGGKADSAASPMCGCAGGCSK